MRVEILTDPAMFRRGRRMLEAMIAAAPMPVDVRTRWSGTPCVLMVYGAGHPVRRPQQFANLRAGGRLVGWDLGYWDKKRGEDDAAAMRLTIDADHPHKLIRPEPPERWDAAGIDLRDDFDPNGPVIVIGMGSKSHRMLGFDGPHWEAKALQRATQAHPGRPILYRPKRPHYPNPAGAWRRIDSVPIEDVLRGASLIVCRHSNVAVDACIAGVPVVCEDGAAAALYGSDVRQPINPTREQRLQFLRSLAWWQWRPEEAAEAWTYLVSRL
jgi:hypothetical protein